MTDFQKWTDSEIGSEIEKFKAESQGLPVNGCSVQLHEVHALLDEADARGLSYDISRQIKRRAS